MLEREPIPLHGVDAVPSPRGINAAPEITVPAGRHHIVQRVGATFAQRVHMIHGGVQRVQWIAAPMTSRPPVVVVAVLPVESTETPPEYTGVQPPRLGEHDLRYRVGAGLR